MGNANAATCEVCKISLDTPQLGDDTDVKISLCPRCRSEWECDLSSIAWFKDSERDPLRVERIDVPVLRPDSQELGALKDNLRFQRANSRVDIALLSSKSDFSIAHIPHYDELIDSPLIDLLKPLDSTLRIDGRARNYLSFSLQFLGWPTNGIVTGAESKKSMTSPEYTDSLGVRIGPRFRWPISRIHVYIKCDVTFHLRRYNYLLLIDRADSSLAVEMKSLFYDRETSVDKEDPKKYDAWQPNVVIPKILYFIALRSSRFLKHAEAHLQSLADTIMTRPDEKPDVKFQIGTTKALHQLMFIWAELRRRVLAALSLVKEIPAHPFIVSPGPELCHSNGEPKMRTSLQEARAMLKDNVERLDSLTEKTKALNSLVFNLANLHDSRAAVEEARAANAVATSLQRITSLTFVYLPITLAATIYGMNLSPITGDEGQKGIWAFFAVSAGLLVVTIGVLGIWIWKSQIVGWFKHGHRGKSKVELYQQEKNIALAEP